MHITSLLRMQWFVNTFLSKNLPTSVLDVGSFEVNAAYKQFFSGSNFSYTGLDMVAGPNVDIVPANAYQWTELADESYDAVISGQAFEHIEFFWLTLAEMARVLKPEGFLCIIAPRDFVRHRYPVDCYRFDADAMVAMARYCNFEPLHASTNLAPAGAPADWYSDEITDSLLVARKPSGWTGMMNPGEYRFEEPDLAKLAMRFVPPSTARLREAPAHLSELMNALEQQQMARKTETALFKDKITELMNTIREQRMAHETEKVRHETEKAQLEEKLAEMTELIKKLNSFLRS